MSTRKPLRPSEWLLFMMPLVLLALTLVARPLRQKVFPTPTPTPIPRPTPTPIPLLWSAYRYNTEEASIPLLPSRDGKTIYTVGQHGRRPGLMSAWNAKTGHLLRSFSNAPSRRNPQAIALTDDGTRLAYTGDGPENLERTGIYDALRGRRLRFLPSASRYGSPCFLPRTHTLVVGRRGFFEVWNSDTGKLLKRVLWSGQASHSNVLKYPSSTPDGRRVVLLRRAGEDNYVYANGGRDEIGLFSTRTWRRTHVFSWPHTNIKAMGFVNNGQSLVLRCTSVYWAKSQSGNNSFYPISVVRLLDWKSGRQRIVQRTPHWQNYYNNMAVSADGRFFALADTFTVYRSVGHRAIAVEKATTYVEIRDGLTGRKQASLCLPYEESDGENEVRDLDFAPDNSKLYFYLSGRITTWSRPQWKIGAQLKVSSLQD